VSAASLVASFVLHAGLVAVIVVGAWIVRLIPHEVVIPIDMTVVVDENLDREPDDLKPSEKPPEPEPPKQEVKPPEPEPPKEKVPDAVVQEKPKKKEFKKGKLVKEDEKKKPEEKKKEEKKFNKSTKIVKGAKTPPPNTGNGPRTEKKLSQAEIDKALAAGAKAGTVNQLAANETQRCFSLIGEQIKRHTPESYQWSPALRPAELEIVIDAGGRITSYRIVATSGDAAFDECVLTGAKNTGCFVGLSAAFISQNRRFVIAVKPVRR